MTVQGGLVFIWESVTYIVGCRGVVHLKSLQNSFQVILWSYKCVVGFQVLNFSSSKNFGLSVKMLSGPVSRYYRKVLPRWGLLCKLDEGISSENNWYNIMQR